MQTNQVAIRAGSAIKSDPVGAFKAFAFFAIAIIAIYLVYKVIRGISSVSDSISNIGGTSEEDKTQILASDEYAAAQKWLDPGTGIGAIAKSKYKSASNYQIQKNVSDSLLNRTAEQVFEAKTGPYANSAEIQGAIAGLPSKAAVSLMALRFQVVYGKRANGSLKAFIANHLNVREIQTLNKVINKKPEL